MSTWRTIVLLLLSWSFCCRSEITCPKKYIETGETDVQINDRMQKLESSSYTVSDDNYVYNIHICDNGNYNGVAVMQTIKAKDGEKERKVVAAKFAHAQVMGGEDWLLIRYIGGQNYSKTHCSGQPRRALIVVNCEPSNDEGTMQIIEEFSPRNNKDPYHDCYYLFGLEHKAACTAKPRSLSPGSTILIIMISLLVAYLGFGFLYQRFIVGAKGIEQIPNLDFWKDFGNLQADGCNFVCRCVSKDATRYRTMDDALADDDEGDDNLLPM